MASSTRSGLRDLAVIAPALEAIVLMVCDQPFVSSHLIHQLVAKHSTSSYPIIASEYVDILGVPALFHRIFFPNLDRLQGDIGAKAIIRQYQSHCLSVPFTEGRLDIDTPEDLKSLFNLCKEET